MSMLYRDAILQGDCLDVLRGLPDGIVQTCVTSPPYWGLRDYNVAGQLGLEATPEEYVAHMVAVFREVRRVLRDDGTAWINIGDSYAGSWGNYAPGGIKGTQRPKTEQGKRWERKAYEEFGTTRKPPTADVPGLKPKDLVGIPWMLAFALRADGWYLRADIIWAKPNPMPESVTDRPTKSHEYLFLLSKSPRYYYDADAIREPHTMTPQRRLTQRHSARDAAMRPDKKYLYTLSDEPSQQGNPAGRNKRSVWTVNTAPYAGAHFATFPPALIEPCVLAGSPVGGLVLDPFMGSGTVGAVARRHSRHYLGIELNPDYIRLAQERIAEERQPVLWSSVAQQSADTEEETAA